LHDVAGQLALEVRQIGMDQIFVRARDAAGAQDCVRELRTALNAAPDDELVVVALVEAARSARLEMRRLFPVFLCTHYVSPDDCDALIRAGCPLRAALSTISGFRFSRI